MQMDPYWVEANPFALGVCPGSSDMEKRLSVTDLEEGEYDINSPGASSTSSEPVYIRKPGFEHHAHEFRVHPTHALMLGIKSEVSATLNKNSNSSKVNERIQAYLGKEDTTSTHSSLFSPPQSPVSLSSPVPSTSCVPGTLNPVCIKSSKTPEPTEKTRNHTPPGSSSKGTKKKKSSEPSVERTDGPGTYTKPKSRREPLPMKLRALPQSFWQQPNRNNNVPPSASVLPPLLLGKDPSDVVELRPVTPPDSGDNKTQSKPERILRVANTELLFSLFDSVEKDDKKKVHVVKKGRPRKSSMPFKINREEDPFLISAATESILPLLPERTPGSSGSSTPLGICQIRGQQVIELMSLKEGDRTVSLPSLNVDHGYSQILSELVLNL